MFWMFGVSPDVSDCKYKLEDQSLAPAWFVSSSVAVVRIREVLVAKPSAADYKNFSDTRRLSMTVIMSRVC